MYEGSQRFGCVINIPSRTSSALNALENTGPGTGGAMPGCHGGRFIGGAGAEAIAAEANKADRASIC